MNTRHKVWVILLAGLVALLTAAAVMRGPTGTTAAGPRLSAHDLQTIMNAAVATANKTASLPGLRTFVSGTPKKATRMWIAIVDREGHLLALHGMTDAWVGSQDIAISKARTAAFFSSDQNALTSRIIGQLSQAHKADGSGGAQPLWGISASNLVPSDVTNSDGNPPAPSTAATRNGLITFPGGVPLYLGANLVGAIGVSGDGVDQDECVAFGGATASPGSLFLPPSSVMRLGFSRPSCPAFPPAFRPAVP